AIELHPVLDIFFRANSLTTVQATGTAVYGEPMTFTATVSTQEDFPTPTGDVAFLDDGASLTTTLDGTGRASFTTTSLGAGTHTVYASYNGDDVSVPSTSQGLMVTIAKADQSITFAAPNGKTYGDAPFTAAASGGASGNPVTFAASGSCTASGVNG